MIEEIWAISNIKVYYTEALTDLIIQEFSALIRKMQIQGDKYKDYITKQYYLLLSNSPLCD